MPGPTFKQMAARMHSGHAGYLETLESGARFLRPDATDGEIRGARIALATLTRWGAIEKDQITDLGRLLLRAWREKQRR